MSAVTHVSHVSHVTNAHTGTVGKVAQLMTKVRVRIETTAEPAAKAQ